VPGARHQQSIVYNKLHPADPGSNHTSPTDKGGQTIWQKMLVIPSKILHQIPTFWLIGGGAVLLVLLAGLTYWLLITKQKTREYTVQVKLKANKTPQSAASDTPPPSWGKLSQMDMVIPPKVWPLGTWDFTEDGPDGILRGFLLFYPGGGSHIQYHESGWNTRDIDFEIKGFNAVGTIEDHGEWNVVFNETGSKARGKLGCNDFAMIRRTLTKYEEASQCYQGTYDLWMTKQQTWLGFVTLDASAGGYLEFENGLSADNWTCETSGMTISSEIPVHGSFSLTLAKDGTVGIAKIGQTKYNVWRRQEGD
jgi:hypothetical protein